jgi:uncharacterized membrane protein
VFEGCKIIPLVGASKVRIRSLQRWRFIGLCWTMLVGAVAASPAVTDSPGKSQHRTAATTMSKTTEPKQVQIVRELNSDEREALEEGLDLAARVADAPRPLDISQVQRLYDDYLNEQITDSDAIIALGLAFGDEVRRRGNLVWARVIDEYGDETCVAAPKRMVHAAPISMIQKRLNRKERVDLAQLRDATLEAMAKQIPDAMARE